MIENFSRSLRFVGRTFRCDVELVRGRGFSR